MPHPQTTSPPALFDVTSVASNSPAGTLVRVPLDELELAPNARREIDPDGIERLARMLATTGQLVPVHRPPPRPRPRPRRALRRPASAAGRAGEPELDGR